MQIKTSMDKRAKLKRSKQKVRRSKQKGEPFVYRTNTSPTRVVSVDERNGRVADDLTHQLGPTIFVP